MRIAVSADAEERVSPDQPELVRRRSKPFFRPYTAAIAGGFVFAAVVTFGGVLFLNHYHMTWQGQTFTETAFNWKDGCARLAVAAFFLSAFVPIYKAVERHCVRSAERAEGSCGTCGYNLTGNVSGVCPECGTPVTDGTKRRSRSGEAVNLVFGGVLLMIMLPIRIAVVPPLLVAGWGRGKRRQAARRPSIEEKG